MNAPPSFLRPLSKEKENKEVPSFLRKIEKQPEFLRKKEEPFVEDENDLTRKIERNIAQQTSRGLETIAGLPGDIESLGRSVLGYSPETFFPTSSSLREKSKELSKGYLEPKTDFEEKVGELVNDITSMALPGAGKYSLVRNIGIPVAANLAKEGLKFTGKEEESKIGTMVLLDLALHRGKGAKAYSGELFKRSRELVPSGQKMMAGNLIKELHDVKTALGKGGSSPSKSAAMSKTKEILKKAKSGQIEVDELMEFRATINELLDEAKAFDISVDPKIQAKKIKNLQNVKSKVINALDEYGKINPEFGKVNKAANESWAVYHEAEKLSNFLNKVGSKVAKSPLTKWIVAPFSGGLGVGAVSSSLGTGALPATLATLGSVGAANEAFKFMYRLKSPTLRGYYGNILKGAATGNANQVTKNIERLDKQWEKEEED